MKAMLLLGILSTSLATVCGAAAQDMSGPERAGYDAGQDAAADFCRDLRAKPHGGYGGTSVTRDYERGCKAGFDDHIDSDRACQERLERNNAYDAMRQARRDTCS